MPPLKEVRKRAVEPTLSRQRSPRFSPLLSLIKTVRSPDWGAVSSPRDSLSSPEGGSFTDGGGELVSRRPSSRTLSESEPTKCHAGSLTRADAVTEVSLSLTHTVDLNPEADKHCPLRCTSTWGSPSIDTMSVCVRGCGLFVHLILTCLSCIKDELCPDCWQMYGKSKINKKHH